MKTNVHIIFYFVLSLPEVEREDIRPRGGRETNMPRRPSIKKKVKPLTEDELGKDWTVTAAGLLFNI